MGKKEPLATNPNNLGSQKSSPSKKEAALLLDYRGQREQELAALKQEAAAVPDLRKHIRQEPVSVPLEHVALKGGAFKQSKRRSQSTGQLHCQPVANSAGRSQPKTNRSIRGRPTAVFGAPADEAQACNSQLGPGEVDEIVTMGRQFICNE